MDNADGEEVKRFIRISYRKSSIIGDGGTAAVRRFEKETGLNLGRNGKNHAKKVSDLIRQIKKSLLKDMTDLDRQFLEERLQKLLDVSDLMEDD